MEQRGDVQLGMSMVVGGPEWRFVAQAQEEHWEHYLGEDFGCQAIV